MICLSRRAVPKTRILLTVSLAFDIGLHLTEAPVIADDLFIDRPVELTAIEDVLQPRSPTQAHRRLIVGGMGGIGKTQLAITYAKRQCHLYDTVFWINAASESVLNQSYRLVARRILDMTTYRGLNDDDEVLLCVTNWLLDIRNTRWLLIFDNYDDPDAYDIGKYCPYGLHGSAIITTRYPDRVRGQQLLIRPMEDTEQSLRILATRSKRANVETGNAPVQCYHHNL